MFCIDKLFRSAGNRIVSALPAIAVILLFGQIKNSAIGHPNFQPGACPSSLVQNLGVCQLVFWASNNGVIYSGSFLDFFDFGHSSSDNLISFDHFVTPEPAPLPIVEIGQLAGKAVLSWDMKAITYRSIDYTNEDSTGSPTYYEFEGYRLYQAPAKSGPWTLIKQWDKKNEIKAIWDQVWNPTSGKFEEQIIADGNDTGLVFSFLVNIDYLTNQPLVNGKHYYFALTTYSYNPAGKPKILENTPRPTTVIPQRPLLNERISNDIGESIDVLHTAGKSEGVVKAKIINPTALNKADYEIQFFTDTADGLYWRVRNEAAGAVVINYLSHLADIDSVDYDDEFPVLNGVQIKVAGPPPGLKPEGWNYSPRENLWLTWELVNTNNPWPLEGFGGAIGWAANFLGGSKVPASALKDIELRFAATDENGIPQNMADPNVSLAYRYLRAVSVSSAPARSEFAPFIINKGSGYVYQDMRPICVSAYDMESIPPRRLALAFLENNAISGKINGTWFPGRHDIGRGNVDGREFLWIFDSDYSAVANQEYKTDILLNSANMDIMYVCVASRFGSALPKSGDKLILSANHPISVADKFTFSTKGMGVQSSYSFAKERLNEINVFPNPYYASEAGALDSIDRCVTFSNLSEKCVIHIYALSGQLIKTIIHKRRFPYEPWNLHNERGQPVASGLYLCIVQVPEAGNKILKLAIVD
jgi:hypothetical protein